MLKQRARLVARSLRFGDMAMLGVAFPVAYYIRDHVISSLGDSVPGLYPISSYWPLLASSLLVWQLAAWMAGLYGIYRTVRIGTELFRLLRTFVILALVIAAGQFVWKNHELSRLFFALYYSSAFALLVANRVTVRVLAHTARRRGFNTRTFAVVGLGETTEGLVEAISAHREWGYVFAGYVLEDGAPKPPGVKVLGRLSEMGEILETHVLDEVIFGAPREKLEDIEQAVLLCEEQGVRVKVLLNFFPARISRIEVEELEGLPILTFSSAPTDAARLVWKRAFDVVASLTVLLLLAPLSVAIAVAIRLESRGPVLFRQRRVGQNGREFWLYKFRSMCVDAEARSHELRHHNEMDGPAFKMREDPRVTRVGRFLRRTSLDEVPQFWNVLRGEMSVVGPRPPLPSEVKLYKRWQRRRLSVRPGITCIWQVSGRNELDFAQWMALDLEYIDNWSLWGDIKIVLQTIPAVIWGKGAR